MGHAVPTRFWSRQLINGSVDPNTPPPGDPNYPWVVNDNALTPNDTIVRQLVDVVFMLQIKEGGAASPAANWWNRIQWPLGIGVDAEGVQTPLFFFAESGDRRVTGTAMATLDSYTLKDSADYDTGYYTLKQTLDTKGMRKSPTAGTRPVAKLTWLPWESAPVIIPNSTWEYDYQINWRILYETP